eukprot:4432629-Pleurochrysis_carterae.AAC.1
MSRAEVLELAHYVPGAPCRACGRVQYDSPAQHISACNEMQRLAASDLKTDERRYAALRRDFAAKHSGQR